MTEPQPEAPGSDPTPPQTNIATHGPLIRLPSSDTPEIEILGSSSSSSPASSSASVGVDSSVSSQPPTQPPQTPSPYQETPKDFRPAIYVPPTPSLVEVTVASLASASAERGARATLTSVTGEERVDVTPLAENEIESSLALPSPSDAPPSVPSSVPTTPSPAPRRPISTPTPPLPAAVTRPERVLEFIALYSYDTTPFVRTGHGTGPSGFDFIAGNALKGQLEYRVPASKDRPKGEDLPESLEHFVYPSGLRLELAPTPPLLHTFVMTCANGSRMYAYVYTKWTVVPDHVLTVVKMQIGENLIDCDDPSPQHLPSTLYGPHSLVFISAFPFYDSLTTTLKYMAERFFMVNIPPQSYVSPTSGGGALTPLQHPSMANNVALIDAIYAMLKDVGPIRVPIASMEQRLADLYPHSLEFRDAVTCYCAQQDQPMSRFASLGSDGRVGGSGSVGVDEFADGGDESDGLDDPDGIQSPRRFVLDIRPASIEPSELASQIDTSLRLCLSQCAFFLPAAPFDNLPLLESSTLGTLFESLDIAHVIAVWNALLCELPCLFVSADIAKLTPSLEALSALLYPCKWPYVYIPVLPIFLTDVLDAPQPFLVGAPREVLDNLPDALTSGETNIVVVDLDLGTMCMSGNLEATQRRRAKAAAAAAAMNASPSSAAAARAAATGFKCVDDVAADQNPFPDPFQTNTRFLQALLHQQGLQTHEDSMTAQLERIFQHNPVTYLGASLLDSVALAPAPLTFADLNPFKSSSSTPTASMSSLDGAGSASSVSIDGDSSGSQWASGEGRHRFLPWNLVWRLFDGLSNILNPLRQNQMQREEEEERANGTVSPGSGSRVTSPTRMGSISMNALSSASQSLPLIIHTPQTLFDVSSPLGGLHHLSSLPPNLPTHAWPVLLPGLVREWRQAAFEQCSKSKRNLLSSEYLDPNATNPLTYLGNESLFLQRFQIILEKLKKPVLLLSTARFLYSGTDASESEGEFVEEEPNLPNNTNTNLSTSTHPNSTATSRPSSLLSTPTRPTRNEHNADQDQKPHLKQAASHHHLIQVEEDAAPALLHMTSTPEVLDSSQLSRPAGLPDMHRSISASVSSTASGSSSGHTLRTTASMTASRLTPMTSDDEGEEDDEEDGDEQAEDSVHDLPQSTSCASRPTQPVAHRASEPSLGFSQSNTNSSLSPFRLKQTSLIHLAPPRLTGSPSIELDSPTTAQTPITPYHDNNHSPATVSPSIEEQASTATTPMTHTPDLITTSIDEEFDLLTIDGPGPYRGRERASIINEVFVRPPPRVLPPHPDTDVSAGAPQSPITIAVHAPTTSVTAVSSPVSPPPPSSTPPPTATIRLPTIALPLRELSSSRPDNLWSAVSGPELMSLRRKFLSVLVSLLHSHRAFTGFARKEASAASGNSASSFSTVDDPFEEDSYEVTFETSSFLRYVQKDYRPFLTVFLETQMMKFFSEERLTRETAAQAAQALAQVAANTPAGGMVKSGSNSGIASMREALESRASLPATPTHGGYLSQTPAQTPIASASASSAGAASGSSSLHSSSSTIPPIPNDWFDRLCAQKRNRTRLLMNASGENGLAGLLYKLGRKVPTWKERWFELNRHGTILRYYAHSTKMIELEPNFKELKRRYKLSPRDLVTKANLDRVAEQREKLRQSLYRGEITIIPGQTIVHIPNQSRKYMTAYGFEVITPTRSLLACAPDLKTRDEWILLIRARAAKLSMDHKRIGNGPNPLLGLGTIPHLESRLQMQVRLLREKNIAARTKAFMDRAAQRRKKGEAEAANAATCNDGANGNGTKDSKSAVDSKKAGTAASSKAPSGSGPSIPCSSSVLGEVLPGSLPHALLVCEHLRTSLDLRKFSTLFKTHPHCFSGKDATNYIQHHELCATLVDSVALCNLMLKESLILNVNHSSETPFKSEPKFMYTFPKHSLLHGAGTGGGANGEEGEVSASSLLPTDEERVIVARMREELDVRDRVHGIFRHQVKDCFVARDAIAWLLDRGICSNESSAVRLTTRLVRTSQVMPIVNSSFGGNSESSFALCANHDVENNGDLYRFHPSIRAMNSCIEERTTAATRARNKK